MSKHITLAKLIAVFGTEDKAPIRIDVEAKKVTATRDDVTLTGPTIDASIADGDGGYFAVIDSEGKVSVSPAPAAPAQRQSPAFESL